MKLRIKNYCYKIKKKMSKKIFEKTSQAALEFLTTYAWAFLVILIMVSTLAYFGILSPSKLLPERCNFGAEFECQNFQISSTSNSIKIRLKNNMGDAITVTSMAVSTESAFPLECSGFTQNPATDTWAGGDIKDFTFSGCNTEDVGFVPGEKGKALIQISYYTIRSGEGYGHVVQGEILATVT